MNVQYVTDFQFNERTPCDEQKKKNYIEISVGIKSQNTNILKMKYFFSTFVKLSLVNSNIWYTDINRLTEKNVVTARNRPRLGEV
jgi:hypothetical protein